MELKYHFDSSKFKFIDKVSLKYSQRIGLHKNRHEGAM
jgi:hypothetical protein